MDRSLDEFLDADDEEHDDVESAESDETARTEAEPGDTAEEAETGETTGDGPPVDTSTVDPAVSTSASDPDGAACADCGRSVRRRWQQDGALVCGECKEW